MTFNALLSTFRSTPAARTVTARLLPVVLSLFTISNLQAQQRDFRGIVVDSASGAPIPGADVRVRGTKIYAITDPEGRFSLRLAESDALVDINMLGYESVMLPLWTPRDTFVTIRLQPNAILLDALEVTVNRLAERRARYTGSVRAIGPATIVWFRYNNAFEVLNRGLISLEPCGPRSEFSCTRRFGRLAQPIVFVDEKRRAGGVDVLKDWQASEIHSMEVYDGGGFIRVYTKQFMEHLARNGIELMPVQKGVY